VASPRTLGIVVAALVVALGIPLYYVFIKKRAAASLDDLMAERFRATRACPVEVVEVPSGGRVTCMSAYDDADHPDVALVLGSWARGTIKVPGGVAAVDNKVAGLYKVHAPAEWVARVRSQPDVIVATEIAGGAIVFWSGLPSRESVLSHFEAAR
jgi:hypothetical protein